MEIPKKHKQNTKKLPYDPAYCSREGRESRGMRGRETRNSNVDISVQPGVCADSQVCKD